MSNRENSGRSALSCWINSSGEIAHPDSPRGGGGSGRFANCKPLGAEGNRSDVVPHPQSPSGRMVVTSDIKKIDLADNTITNTRTHSYEIAAKARRPVVLKEFNNNGQVKYVDAIKGNPMGVHPPGNFPFVNAVELIFTVDEKVATKMGIRQYRCRQRVYTQELWEGSFNNDGKDGGWIKTMSGGGEPDDPDEGLQKTSPPILAFHDAPGFMATVKDAQLKGPGGKLTSKTAVVVFLRQNFIAWIEGARGRGERKTWEPVSDEVKWHSNQSLVFYPFGKNRWATAAEGSEIELGHTQGKPK